MAYYDSKQLLEARKMDLLTYLQTYEPTELVKLRGKALYLDKSIEQFGSGFKRIDGFCRDAGIKYGYEELDNGFKLIIYRDTMNVSVNVPVNSTEETVLALLKHNPEMTREELAEKAAKTVRTIQRALTALKTKGMIEREGSDKTGHWIIKE